MHANGPTQKAPERAELTSVPSGAYFSAASFAWNLRPWLLTFASPRLKLASSERAFSATIVAEIRLDAPRFQNRAGTSKPLRYSRVTRRFASASLPKFSLRTSSVSRRPTVSITLSIATSLARK